MTATLPSLPNLKPNPAWASLPLLDRTGWKRVWFGKRRAYPRKVAVTEFEAVVDPCVARCAHGVAEKFCRSQDKPPVVAGFISFILETRSRRVG
jgi:hypothetical protein